MPASNATLDRRHSPRAHVHGHAIVHAPIGVARCEIENLSVGGALLRPSLGTLVDLATGTQVVVDLHLAGTCGWYGQRGRVRRHDGGAGPFAIAFEGASPELEDLIEDEVLDELEATRSPRVLVVDIAPDRRRRLAIALRRAGACPLEADDPFEAIALMEQSHDHLSGAIIAESLGLAGGRELAQFLADTHRGIRLAVIADAPPHARRHDAGLLWESPDGGWPEIDAFLGAVPPRPRRRTRR